MLIVNKYDLLGGISLAPVHEYYLEVASIIIQLDSCQTKEEIYHLVLTEFERWLSKINEMDFYHYQEMAEEIYG